MVRKLTVNIIHKQYSDKRSDFSLEFRQTVACQQAKKLEQEWTIPSSAECTFTANESVNVTQLTTSQLLTRMTQFNNSVFLPVKKYAVCQTR